MLLVGLLLVCAACVAKAQFEQPEFSLTPEEACAAYPGYVPVTLSPRQQFQLLGLGLTQYKVQKQAQCPNGLFIRNEATPYQLTVAVCQQEADERLFRVLFNITGRCQTETEFLGIVNQLLDASLTTEGPAVRFVDEVSLKDVTNGTLVQEDVAMNSGLCDVYSSFVSTPLTEETRGLLTQATTRYKVDLRQSNTCPVGVLIFQEQVPEKLLVDVCANEFDSSVFQVFFNVTSFCIQSGDVSEGQGTVRSDLFTAVISTIPLGIMPGTFRIINTTIPEYPPFFTNMEVISGSSVEALPSEPETEN
eukprot:TRINITY_DN401_c0_g1_i1.p2 TRINITY_DN401_c0_g1~~TRINITY_DN401_c0_g1_i1.p2  ORF type:complete len:305 (-),score=19.45 TRINITY_DN401_c0_g1_i1:596-1510(-)